MVTGDCETALVATLQLFNRLKSIPFEKSVTYSARVKRRADGSKVSIERLHANKGVQFHGLNEAKSYPIMLRS